MRSIALFGSWLLAATLPAAPAPPETARARTSLAAWATQIRPGFLLGSFASGLDPTRPEFAPRAEFFRQNFNIMTVGVYMNGIQRTPGDIDFRQVDALVGFAAEHGLKVYLHPLVGGAEYTPKWVNEGGFSKEELLGLMRRRIRAILGRHPGRVQFVDVVNEALRRRPPSRAPVAGGEIVQDVGLHRRVVVESRRCRRASAVARQKPPAQARLPRSDGDAASALHDRPALIRKFFWQPLYKINGPPAAPPTSPASAPLR